MTNIPELTDDEATVLRFLTISQTDRFTATVPKIDSIANDDDVSLAALAAYDAQKRAEIRVEAMREIKTEVETLASAFRKLGDPFPEALAASRTILRGIDEKIAKEPTP